MLLVNTLQQPSRTMMLHLVKIPLLMLLLTELFFFFFQFILLLDPKKRVFFNKKVLSLSTQKIEKESLRLFHTLRVGVSGPIFKLSCSSSTGTN